jgi:hypothetical protein
MENVWAVFFKLKNREVVNGYHFTLFACLDTPFGHSASENSGIECVVYRDARVDADPTGVSG